MVPRAPHATTHPPADPPASHKPPTSACLTIAMSGAVPPGAGSQTLWACKAVAKEAALLLTGGSSQCLVCKAPETPGHWPRLAGQLWSQRPTEGPFSPAGEHSPLTGRLPCTGCQLREHKGSQTRTLLADRSALALVCISNINFFLIIVFASFHVISSILILNCSCLSSYTI